MNTSMKCNCCCKESVCKYKVDYEMDCNTLPKSIIGKTTELRIVCKEFQANQPTIKGIDLTEKESEE